MKTGTVRVMLNPSACQGCRACEAVCSLKNHGAVNPEYTGIKIVGQGEHGKFKQVICMQCEEMYCALSCPENVIKRDGRSGAVSVSDNCTGCGTCVKACPIEAIKIIEIDGCKRANMCNLCGGQPQCVNVCPRNSIGW